MKTINNNQQRIDEIKNMIKHLDNGCYEIQSYDDKGFFYIVNTESVIITSVVIDILARHNIKMCTVNIHDNNTLKMLFIDNKEVI